MNKKHALLFITILLLTTIACELSFASSNGPSEEDITIELTRVSLQQTQTTLAQPPTPQPEESPEAESEDDSEADSEDEGDEDACYFSRWTGDETILDGTIFDPGDNFVKSWTLRNAGTCDWTTGARMVFEEGDQMGGPDSINLTETVEPGETYVVEIPMQAPASDGDYTGVWRMTAADGTKMGKYWVKITVGDTTPPAAFSVTSVSYSMPLTTIPIVCPSKTSVDITVNITASSAGTVTYKWDDSKGCSGCGTKSISFDSAGTKSVTHSMLIGAAGDHWAKIYIDEPNHQWFGQQNYKTVCNP